MKKLKLRALDFEGAEILTREQLKKILGGGMMGTSGGTDPVTEGGTNAICTCNDGHSAGMHPDDCGKHCTSDDYCKDHGGGGSCS